TTLEGHMRFISIFTHEPTNRAPTQEEMTKMGKLVQEAMQEGWLLATEGVSFGEKGFRVHKGSGSETVVMDGPFAETKEVLGGYALLKADSKAHVTELAKRFLSVAGGGTCEIYQLYEMPCSVPA
ncbi:MAG: YciI family protein, partial [Pseudomonadota bacterium]